jgi:predicted XRE-type DNA-binding protein
MRSILAAQIVRVLDEAGMSVRRAEEASGTAAADFSRLRRANLGSFTVDRQMRILHRLGHEVDVSVDVRPQRGAEG